MELKGSKTEANLQAAFAGESQARNKYSYFAKTALWEKLNQIAGIFTETSNNEEAHAKIWYKYLNGGKIGDTIENLKIAIAGEHWEWTEMYPGFAETAREEGFSDIAAHFTMVGEIEKTHEARYDEILKRLENKDFFERKEVVTWHCRNCGHIHVGEHAPLACPVCHDEQGMFELLAKNY
jgi:rubrerythrin